VPFWLPQSEKIFFLLCLVFCLTFIIVDTDILKPNTGYLPTERPASHTTSPYTSTDTSSSPSEDRPSPYAEPLSEDEDDEEMNVHPAKDESKRTGLTGLQVAEAIAFREKMLKERAGQEVGSLPQSLKVRSPMPHRLHDDEADDEGDVKKAVLIERDAMEGNGNGKNKLNLNGNGKQKFGRVLSIDPLAPSSAFDETLRNRLRGAKQEEERGRKGESAIEEDDEVAEGEAERDDVEEGMSNGTRGGDDRVLTREWTAAPGKRIAVPVRIEPKVYFAAERTFLVCFKFEQTLFEH
jgi:hypothetical protein